MVPTTLTEHRNSDYAHTAGAYLGRERGQTTAEYAVILTVITTAIILAIVLLSTSLASHVTDIANLVGP